MQKPAAYHYLRFTLWAGLACMLGTATLLMLRNHYIDGKVDKTLRQDPADFSVTSPAHARDTIESLVVLFGNSRVQLWSPAPSSERLRFVMQGVGGDTSGKMLGRFGRDVLALNPRMVMIQAGINDLVAANLDKSVSKVIMERLKENLAMMVQAAVNQGVDVLLLTVVRPAQPSLLHRLVLDDDIYLHVDEINTFIRQLEKQQDVTIIDADAILTTDPQRFERDYALDALHWRAAGYRALNTHLEQYWTKNAVQ